MKSYSIILLALVSIILANEKTKVYKCGDELKLDTCYLHYSTETESIYYYKACRKGRYCEYDDAYEGFGQCIKIPAGLDEGDKCLVSMECKTGICDQNKKKCVFVADGAECKSNENCGYKSFCQRYTEGTERKGKCAPLIEEGQSCKDDKGVVSECKIGLLCGAVDGATDYTCIKMYSVDDGKTVTVSEDYDEGQLCKSGDVDYSDNKCREKEEKATEWKNYVDAFQKELDDGMDDEQTKFTKWFYYYGKQTLGSKTVIEKYVEYEYKDKIGTGDDADCIKDYFIRQELSSNGLNISSISLLLLFFTII